MLTELCIYTIKHSDDLKASLMNGGCGTFTEHRRWARARKLLDIGNKEGKRLPVIFAPAEATSSLFGWALLDDVKPSEISEYTFSGMQEFNRNRKKTSLKKASNGEPLGQWYIRPYAICKTPKYLVDQSPVQFVSYHNLERMGYTIDQAMHFSVGTKKSFDNLMGKRIWSVYGEGKPRKYYLKSTWVVDEINNSSQDEFPTIAYGSDGFIFDPSIPLNQLSWFPSFLKSQGNFGLGLQVINEDFVAKFETIWSTRQSESSMVTFPDEARPTRRYPEGAVKQVFVNAYERNRQARQECIDNYGASCEICEINFGQFYGPEVNGLIHVHHLRPLNEIRGKYTVDAINDLIPVCPNCHAVLHSKAPPYHIEEVKQFLKRQKGL